jgi:hypothetical protein
MTAAFQPRTSGPAHHGPSRFFASPPRAPRSRHARPAKRVAGQKTASRNFFSAAPKTCPEIAPQVTHTHQESLTYVFVFVSGCVSAPNSGANGVGALTAGDVLTAAVSNLSIKGGSDAAFGVGASAVVDRGVNGGSAKIDAIAGGGIIAYAGIEGKIVTSSKDPTFSLSVLGAAGLALGFNADITMNRAPVDITFSNGARIPVWYPTLNGLSFFIGVGVGGELKVGRPDPSFNLGTVEVDNKSNFKKSGPLGPNGGG